MNIILPTAPATPLHLLAEAAGSANGEADHKSQAAVFQILPLGPPPSTDPPSHGIAKPLQVLFLDDPQKKHLSINFSQITSFFVKETPMHLVPIREEDLKAYDVSALLQYPTIKQIKTPLCSAIRVFFKKARTIVANAVLKSKQLKNVAKILLDFKNAITQLYDYQHLEMYCADPTFYLEIIRKMNPEDPCWSVKKSETVQVFNGDVKKLIQKGEFIFKKLLYRIDQSRLLLREASLIESKVDPYFSLKMIGRDAQLGSEISRFMEETALKLKCISTTYEKELDALYNAMKKEGMPWPHSREMRIAINEAGFISRPRILKRDRCFCYVCEAEVIGWRVWDDPFEFHDLKKHPPGFTRWGSIWQSIKADILREYPK